MEDKKQTNKGKTTTTKNRGGKIQMQHVYNREPILQTEYHLYLQMQLLDKNQTQYCKLYFLFTQGSINVQQWLLLKRSDVPRICSLPVGCYESSFHSLLGKDETRMPMHRVDVF